MMKDFTRSHGSQVVKRDSTQERVIGAGRHNSGIP
jgi:D-alanyl-D-alanine carboxypeptidase